MEDCVKQKECDVCKELYDEINRSQNRRIDSLEQEIRQVHSLTVAVEKMAISLENMTVELKKQGERLGVLEAEPGKKWREVTGAVIIFIVSAVLTYVFTRIGIK